MFTSFTALNYKNLQADNVALGKTNVLVGPNNSGKSNFLKAFGFGRDLVRAETGKEKTKLQTVVEQHGGIGLPKRGGNRRVSLDWRLHSKDTYHLNFEVNNLGVTGAVKETGATINEEVFPYDKQPNSEANLIVGHAHNIYWQMDLTLAFSASRLYQTTRFVHESVATPIPRESGVSTLSPNASNFANALWQLDQTPDGLGPLTERLQEALRPLKRIWVGEGGDYRWVNLKLGDQQYSLHEVSDGTIQVLLLAYILFGMTDVSVLAIDEPELNLHPAWLQIVGRWLQRPTSAEQVFVSTHSSDLLDTFTEGFRTGDVHLLVFDEAGTVRRVLPADLDPLLKEGWELGDIYRVGDRSMGGWPW